MISEAAVSSVAPPARAYRADIDGLRAVAVAVVLFYHLGVLGFSGGFVGVDIFFVISGFLITGLIRDEVMSTGSFRFGNFYLRRARRLLPALGVTLAACLVAAAFLFPPEPFQRFAASLVASILSVSNIWFWTESGYFDAAAITKPLLHTWSLSVEEQFYFIWPAVLYFSMRLKRGSAPLLALFLIGSLSLLWNFDLAHFDSAVTRTLAPAIAKTFSDQQSSIFYLPVFRVFEFAIGAALNWMPRPELRKSWPAELATLSALGLIAVSVVLFSKDDPFPTWRALLPCLGTALLIHFARDSRLTGWMCVTPVVWLGRISYSLYLVHWPVIVFYLYYRDTTSLSALEQTTIGTVSIFTAGLIYQFVEQPLRTPGRTRAANARFLAGAAAVALSFVSLGAAAYATGGAAWRYAPEIADLQPVERVGPKDFACFMGPSLTFRDIDPRCYLIDPGSSKKSILLFGDSTAEHLVSGLRHELGSQYQILQFASSSCPSVLNYSEPDTPHCAENNNEFLNRIVSENRYDLVLISNTSRWDALIAGFPETARRLEAAGIEYAMIGQTPYFDDLPSNIIARRPVGSDLQAVLRDRLLVGCDGYEHGLDALVPPERFFSMKNLLCIGPDPIYEIAGRPIHKDHIHLNGWGSEEVGRALAAWIEAHDMVEHKPD